MATDDVDSVWVFAFFQSCNYITDDDWEKITSITVRLLLVSNHLNGHLSLAGCCIFAKFGRNPISRRTNTTFLDLFETKEYVVYQMGPVSRLPLGYLQGRPAKESIAALLRNL